MKTITTLQGYSKATALKHGWQRVINTMLTLRGYVGSENSQAGCTVERTVGAYSGVDPLRGTKALSFMYTAMCAVVASWQQANAPPHGSKSLSVAQFHSFRYYCNSTTVSRATGS